MTPEQIGELLSLLESATDREISPYARNVHHNKLADRLIWNGADGGDGDLHELLDVAGDHEAACNEAERWAAMDSDLHGTVRTMVNELQSQRAKLARIAAILEPLRALEASAMRAPWDFVWSDLPSQAVAVAARNALPALLREIQETP